MKKAAQLVSYPGHFSPLRKKGSSKGLAAASFFAFEDKRMVARVLRSLGNQQETMHLKLKYTSLVK